MGLPETRVVPEAAVTPAAVRELSALADGDGVRRSRRGALAGGAASVPALGAQDATRGSAPEIGGTMGKLFLVIIVGLAVAMYFPDTRASLLQKGEPVLRPVLTWNAEREMEEIIRGLQQMENVERRLPAKGEWVKWVNDRYARSEE